MRLKRFVWLLAAMVAPCVLAYEKEIRAMAATMAESIGKSGKKTVAVVDFTDLQGNVTELGRFLAEEFSVALAGAGKGFEVVDRTHLKAVLAEHRLASTGLIDPATARKLGQITGVEALVTGTITPFGEHVRVAVKVMDSETAKVVFAVATELPKTKAVEELLGKALESRSQPAGAPGSAQAVTAGQLAGAKPPIPHAPPSPTARAELGGVSFEVAKCVAQRNKVFCGVMVTATKKACYLTLFDGRYNPPSRAFDKDGLQYLAAEVGLASKTSSPYSYVQTPLALDVPAKAILAFEDVPEHVTSFSVLVLSAEVGESAWVNSGLQSQVALRNVPVSR